jgi:hypothetical protein
VFIKQFYDLPFTFMGYSQFYTSPAHIHVFVIATFASIIAPFGGFFASGVKRAFRIKVRIIPNLISIGFRGCYSRTRGNYRQIRLPRPDVDIHLLLPNLSCVQVS